MASDQSLTSSKIITLNVESSPLEADIRGGSLRSVGANDILKLDASRSKDPDKSSETPWYKWECSDASGQPCFVPNPSDSTKKILLVMPTTAKVTLDVAKNFESNSE